jgi:spore maturation protein CgeB
MSKALSLVFLGLSVTSSWGNGHATTYRALIRGLARLGHKVLFLERDMPWYARHRDIPRPDFCRLGLYRNLEELRRDWTTAVRTADAVIVGSYVPDGIEVIDFVLDTAQRTAFYDIDTPVTLAKLGRKEAHYLSPEAIGQFDIYFSFTGGPTLLRLEREFGARRAEALYCGVDETRYRNTGDKPHWDLSYLGTYSADRQPALERLLLEPARRLPNRHFVVAGPQYPADIAWPANVKRLEHLPPEEHARFYSRSRFTLNITRSDMIAAGWSPSVRLFEAAACGVPIISDRWEGLGELLPEGKAILIADTADDVIRALTQLDRKRRSEIGRKARHIVLQSHTGIARAETLLRLMDLVEARPMRRGDKAKQACETILP